MTLYDKKVKTGNLTDKSKPAGTKEFGKEVNRDHYGKDSSGQNHVFIQEHKGKAIQSAGSPDAQKTGDYSKISKEAVGKEAANTAIDSAVSQMNDEFKKNGPDADGGSKKLDKSDEPCDWDAKMTSLKKALIKNTSLAKAVPPKGSEAEVVQKYGKNSKQHQQYNLVMDEDRIIDRHGENSPEHKNHIKHMQAAGIHITANGKAGLSLAKGDVVPITKITDKKKAQDQSDRQERIKHSLAAINSLLDSAKKGNEPKLVKADAPPPPPPPPSAGPSLDAGKTSAFMSGFMGKSEEGGCPMIKACSMMKKDKLAKDDTKRADKTTKNPYAGV